MITGLLKYLLFMPCHAVLTVLSYPLVCFLVLFQKDAWLPSWCWWFQTWDCDLDGDAGWKAYHVPFPNATGGFKLYWNRVRWLWRNPVYGFERKLLGANLPMGIHYNISGDPLVGGIPMVYGAVWTVAGSYVEFAWSVKFGDSAFNGMLGWKLRDALMFKREVAPIVTTIRYGKVMM